MAFRRQLLELVSAEPRTASSLARELGLDRRDMEDDLRHMIRSARAAGHEVVVEPARCKRCGFVFEEERLSKPGRCPACRESRIYEPLISVAKHGGSRVTRTSPEEQPTVMADGAGARVSLETFRLLVEESLTGIYLIQNDRFVYVNRRFAEMFGYTREEVLELPSVMDLIAENDRAMVAEKMRQRLDGEIDSVEYSIRGLRKDGQRIDLDARGARTTHEGRPAVMGSMADITKQKQVEDALRHLSLVDELTGVYNRRGFMTLAESHLTLARRRKRELLLVFADVDHLKSINDSFGHLAGDQILVDAAALLRRTYRSADIIARIGGDEFTAFPLEAGPESAALLLERLQKNVEQHNLQVQRPYKLSMSVGIGRFDPAKCQTVQQLLEEADAELYSRKRGRSTPELL